MTLNVFKNRDHISCSVAGLIKHCLSVFVVGTDISKLCICARKWPRALVSKYHNNVNCCVDLSVLFTSFLFAACQTVQEMDFNWPIESEFKLN